MTRKILESCPSCGGGLDIMEVHCRQCETQVRSRYRPCDFCGLTEEQSTFLRIFVTSRGNLSEVEKRLGVSYPTVRAKLDEVIERLVAAEQAEPIGPPPTLSSSRRRRSADGERSAAVSGESGNPDTAASASPQRLVLEAVARGEITPAEAAVRLQALGGTPDDTV